MAGLNDEKTDENGLNHTGHEIKNGINDFFNPGSIAVVGASENPEKVGYAVLNNIKDGYRGKVYAVNPGHDEIIGIPCFPSILDIPDKIDCAIIIVKSSVVPGVVEQCGQKGIRNAVIISSGFKEVGQHGLELERQLAGVAEKHGIRVLGPNCFGIINTEIGLNATFASNKPERGSVAVISQSGAICASILDWAETRKLGFSKFASLGNKLDITETELLLSWKDDPDTRVIVAYLEEISNGRAFIEAAREVTSRIPVIVIKSGRTSAGARAATSHTGSLAGMDAAYDAAFRQCGIIRSDGMIEAFELASAISSLKPLKGSDIAVVTNAGGPGIMAADACEMYGLEMASLNRETVEKLKEGLPPISNFYNPVDITGSSGIEEYRHAILNTLADENVNGMVVIYTAVKVLDPFELARNIHELMELSEKPILPCLLGGAQLEESVDYLRERGIQVCNDPGQAMSILAGMKKQSENAGRTYDSPEKFNVDRKGASQIIIDAKKNGRKVLGLEALDLLKAYGIDHARYSFTGDLDETISAASGLEYPLALKVVSEAVTHKSEAGGVRLNIRDEDELRRAYEKMIIDVHRYAQDAYIEGVLLQEMIEGGREVIIGASDDPNFGPLLMFGLGGIYVEVLRDVSFRISPVSGSEAGEMIREIRGYPLLEGVRGETPGDTDSLIETIQRVSQLVTDFPEIKELDLNPLIVFEKGMGCKAIDLRVVLD